MRSEFKLPGCGRQAEADHASVDQRLNQSVSTADQITKKVILNVHEGSRPNSCLVFINKTRWRALVDTGADICIINDKMYRKIRPKQGLRPISHLLQGAGGKQLAVRGITEIEFKLGTKMYKHKFYVIKNSTRNMILGLDFLQKHNARIYLDLERMRIDEEYIELYQDVHIGSIVGLADSVILPHKQELLYGEAKERWRSMNLGEGVAPIVGGHTGRLCMGLRNADNKRCLYTES